MLDTITGRTRIHVLIGSPIRQVLAPGILTRQLLQAGCYAILVPLQIEPNALEQGLRALMAMPNIDSILVTLPHKFTAFEYRAAVSPRAHVLGAVNAMRRLDNGTWYGENFDGAGFVAGLENARHFVRGKRVYMAGAGAPPRRLRSRCWKRASITSPSTISAPGHRQGSRSFSTRIIRTLKCWSREPPPATILSSMPTRPDCGRAIRCHWMLGSCRPAWSSEMS